MIISCWQIHIYVTFGLWQKCLYFSYSDPLVRRVVLRQVWKTDLSLFLQYSTMNNVPITKPRHRQVWQGEYNNTLAVAVKQLKQGSMSREEFLKEATVMKNLKHEKLAHTY